MEEGDWDIDEMERELKLEPQEMGDVEVKKLRAALNAEKNAKEAAQAETKLVTEELRKLQRDLDKAKAGTQSEQKQSQATIVALNAQLESERMLREALKGQAEAKVRKVRAEMSDRLGAAEAAKISADAEIVELKAQLRSEKQRSEARKDGHWGEVEVLRAQLLREQEFAHAERARARREKTSLKAQFLGEDAPDDAEVQRAHEEAVILREQLEETRVELDKLKASLLQARRRRSKQVAPNPEQQQLLAVLPVAPPAQALHPLPPPKKDKIEDKRPERKRVTLPNRVEEPLLVLETSKGAEKHVASGETIEPLPTPVLAPSPPEPQAVLKRRSRIKRKQVDERLLLLFLAVEEGDQDQTCSLLQQGVVPCVLDAFGTSPLHVACSQGNLDLVKMLLPVSRAEELDCNSMTCGLVTAVRLRKALDRRRRRLLKMPSQGAPALDASSTLIAPDSAECATLEQILHALMMHSANPKEWGRDAGKPKATLEVGPLHGVDLEREAGLEWKEGLAGYQPAAFSVLEGVLDAFANTWEACCGRGGLGLAKTRAVREHWGVEFDVLNKEISSGRTHLHYAAASGHVEACKILIEASADAAARDFLGKTALHCACEGGHGSVVCLLLDTAPGLADAIDFGGKSALHSWQFSAAREIADEGMVKLAMMIKVHTADVHGQVAGHIAAVQGSKAEVMALAKHLASFDCNQREEGGRHSALTFMREFHAEFSLGYRYRLNKHLRSGETPLEKASVSRSILQLAIISENFRAIEGLMDACGLDQFDLTPDVVDCVFASRVVLPESLTSAAWHAAKSSNRWPSNASRSLVEAVAADSSCNASLGSVGKTILGVCVSSANLDLVKLAIEKGAIVSNKTGDEIPPLLLACLVGHTEIAYLLLRSGASPDAGREVLYEYQNLAAYLCFGELLSKKESGEGEGLPELEAKDGEQLVAKMTFGKLVSTLGSKGRRAWLAKRTKLNKHVLDVLVSAVDKEGSRGDPCFITCLAVAIYGGHIEIVKQLLTSGADFSQVLRQDKGKHEMQPMSALGLVLLLSPHSRAAVASTLDEIGVLIAAKVDLLKEQKGSLYQNVLTEAILKGLTKTALVLVASHEAEVIDGLRQSREDVPAVLACAYAGNAEVMDALLAKGVNMKVKCHLHKSDNMSKDKIKDHSFEDEGRSLLEVCASLGNFDCAAVVCKAAWVKDWRGLNIGELARGLLLASSSMPGERFFFFFEHSHFSLNLALTTIWGQKREEEGMPLSEDDSGQLPMTMGSEEIERIQRTEGKMRLLVLEHEKWTEGRESMAALDSCVEACFQQSGTFHMSHAGASRHFKAFVRNRILTATEWYLISDEKASAKSLGISEMMYEVCALQNPPSFISSSSIGLDLCALLLRLGVSPDARKHFTVPKQYIIDILESRRLKEMAVVDVVDGTEAKEEGGEAQKEKVKEDNDTEHHALELEKQLMETLIFNGYDSRKHEKEPTMVPEKDLCWVSCLAAAIFFGHVGLVSKLIDSGATVRGVMGFGAEYEKEEMSALDLVLFLASNIGKTSVRLALAVVDEMGAFIATRIDLSKERRRLQGCDFLSETIKKGLTRTSLALIAGHGVQEINELGQGGNSVIFACLVAGSVSVMEALLAKGVDIQVKNEQGKSVIEMCLTLGRFACAAAVCKAAWNNTCQGLSIRDLTRGLVLASSLAKTFFNEVNMQQTGLYAKAKQSKTGGNMVDLTGLLVAVTSKELGEIAAIERKIRRLSEKYECKFKRILSLKQMDVLHADLNIHASESSVRIIIFAATEWYLQGNDEIDQSCNFFLPILVSSVSGVSEPAKSALLSGKASANIGIAVNSPHSCINLKQIKLSRKDKKKLWFPCKGSSCAQCSIYQQCEIEDILRGFIHRAIASFIPFPTQASPLCIALACRNLDFAELLIAHGADCKIGVTASDGTFISDLMFGLMSAPKCVNSNSQIESVLMQIHDVSATFCGDSLHLAIRKGYSKLAAKLLEHNDAGAFLAKDRKSLTTAVSSCDAGLFKLLLEKGAEYQNSGPESSQVPILSALLSHNPITVVLCSDCIEDHTQVLIVSALSGNEECFSLRWQKVNDDQRKAAVLEGRSEWGHSLLMCCVRGGNLAIVNKVLSIPESEDVILQSCSVSFGKIKESRCVKQMDALTLSIEMGNQDITIELIRRCKAIKNDPGYDWLHGRTLIQLACGYGLTDVLRALFLNDNIEAKDEPSALMWSLLMSKNLDCCMIVLEIHKGVVLDRENSLLRFLPVIDQEAGARLFFFADTTRIVRDMMLQAAIRTIYGQERNDMNGMIEAIAPYLSIHHSPADQIRPLLQQSLLVRETGRTLWKRFGDKYGGDKELSVFLEKFVSCLPEDQVSFLCGTAMNNFPFLVPTILLASKATSSQASQIFWNSLNASSDACAKATLEYLIVHSEGAFDSSDTFVLDDFDESAKAYHFKMYSGIDFNMRSLLSVEQKAFEVAVRQMCDQTAAHLLATYHSQWKDSKMCLFLLLTVIGTFGAGSRLARMWKSLLPCCGLEVMIDRCQGDAVVIWSIDSWNEDILQRVFGSPVQDNFQDSYGEDVYDKKEHESKSALNDDRPLDQCLQEHFNYLGRPSSPTNPMSKSPWEIEDITCTAEESGDMEIQNFRSEYSYCYLPTATQSDVREANFSKKCMFYVYSHLMMIKLDEVVPKPREALPFATFDDFASRSDMLTFHAVPDLPSSQSVSSIEGLFFNVFMSWHNEIDEITSPNLDYHHIFTGDGQGTQMVSEHRARFCNGYRVGAVLDWSALSTANTIYYSGRFGHTYLKKKLPPLEAFGVYSSSPTVPLGKRNAQTATSAPHIPLVTMDNTWVTMQSCDALNEVQSLDLTGIRVTQRILGDIMSQKSLIRLSLAQSDLGQEFSSAISALMGALPSLRMVDLDHNSLGDQGLKDVTSVLHQCVSLEFLSMAHNGITNAYDFASALESLPSGHSLKFFGLCGNSFDEDSLAAIANACAKSLEVGSELHSCTVGNVKSYSVSSQGADFFSSGNDFYLVQLRDIVRSGSISRKEQAQALSWSSAVPSTSDISFLMFLLSSQSASRLSRAVKICDLDIGNKGVEQIVNSLESHGGSLDRLQLVNAGILQHGVERVCKILLPRLSTHILCLDLSSNQGVNDEIAQALSHTFIAMSVLQRLSLANVNLTDTGLSLLCEPLSEMRSLREIDISSNKFSVSDSCAVKMLGSILGQTLQGVSVKLDHFIFVGFFVGKKDLEIAPIPDGSDSAYSELDCVFMAGLISASEDLVTLRLMPSSSSITVANDHAMAIHRLEYNWADWQRDTAGDGTHDAGIYIDVPKQLCNTSVESNDWHDFGSTKLSLLISGLSQSSTARKILFADRIHSIAMYRLPTSGASHDHSEISETILPLRNLFIDSEDVYRLKFQNKIVHRSIASMVTGQISHLVLSSCNLSSVAGELVKVVRSVAGNLQVLKIARNGFEPLARKRLANVVRLCTSLTDLSVAERDWNQPEWTAAVADLPNLVYLDDWYASEKDFSMRKTFGLDSSLKQNWSEKIYQHISWTDLPAPHISEEVPRSYEFVFDTVDDNKQRKYLLPKLPSYMYLFFARRLSAVSEEQRLILQQSSVLRGNDSLLRLSLNGYGLTTLPEDIKYLLNIEHIDVSDNNIFRLPVEALCEMAEKGNLKSIECRGNPRLVSPPPEVTGQSFYSGKKSGEVAESARNALDFLMKCKTTGKANHDMLMVVIGDGEAGKTSVINALLSESDQSGKIHEDARTVGIDIKKWTPNIDSPIHFSILDLAGQAVYALTHQFFLVRRGVYLLVWKACKDHSEEKERALESMIIHWCDSLQLRVPGATIMLAVTHIDLVTVPGVLDSQIDQVRKVIQRKLREQNAMQGSRVLPLRVLNDGLSMRVNCLMGNGVHELRETLLRETITLPWYAELIPGAYLKLREYVMAKSNGNEDGSARRGYLMWDEYSNIGRDCGLETLDELKNATNFLHEAGILKHFDDIQDCNDRVFINSHWIIDALKGLIRHDRQLLLDWFKKVQDTSEQRKWTRKVLRLTTYGLLHKDLVPYLWPKMEKSADFWAFAMDNDRERTLWSEDVAQTQDSYDSIIKLLRGCEIIEQISTDEWIVPGLLSSSNQQKMDARAMSSLDCPFSKSFVYYNLPPGFFDRMLTSCRRSATRMEFTSTTAVLYWRGYKSQIFLTKEDREETIAADEEDIQGDNNMEVKEIRSAVRITVMFSFTDHLEKIENAITKLERFFPGMQRLDPDQEQRYPSLTPKQIHILTSYDSPETRVMVSKYLCKHIIEEDRKQQSSQFGLEVAVSKTRTRVECFEAHLSALARTSARWLIHTIESILSMSDKVDKSGLQLTSFLDVVDQYFFSPGEWEAAKVSDKPLYDSKSWIAHERMLRKREYKNSLMDIAGSACKQKLEGDIGVISKAEIEVQIRVLKAIKPSISSNDNGIGLDLGMVGNLIQEAIKSIEKFVSYDDPSLREHLPRWKPKFLPQVREVQDMSAAIINALKSFPPLLKSAEDCEKKNSELSNWFKKDVGNAQKPNTPGSQFGSTKAGRQSRPTTAKSRPSTGGSSLQAGKKRVEAEAPVADVVQGLSAGSSEYKPRLIVEFEKLVDAACELMPKISHVVSAWRKSDSSNFSDFANTEEAAAVFMNKIKVLAERETKIAQEQEAAIAESNSLRQQQMVQVIRSQVARMVGSESLNALLEEKSLRNLMEEDSRITDNVQACDGIIRGWLGQQKKKLIRKKEKLRLTPSSTELLQDVEELLRIIKETGFLLSSNPVSQTGKKGESANFVYDIVSRHETELMAQSSSIKLTYLKAYTSVINAIDGATDAAHKDLVKDIIPREDRLELVSSKSSEAVKDALARATKNVTNVAQHTGDVLDHYRSNLSDQFKLWDAYSESQLLQMSLLVGVWYGMPSQGPDVLKVKYALDSIHARYNEKKWQPSFSSSWPAPGDRINPLSKNITVEWMDYVFLMANVSWRVNQALKSMDTVMKQIVKESADENDLEWFKPVYTCLESQVMQRLRKRFEDIRKRTTAISKITTGLVSPRENPQDKNSVFDDLKRSFNLMEPHIMSFDSGSSSMPKAKQVAKYLSLLKLERSEIERKIESGMKILERDPINQITNQDMVEVRAYSKPPKLLLTVVEAICVLLHIKPEMVPDPDVPGRQIPHYWNPFKKVASRSADFLRSLTEFDIDSVDSEVMERVREIKSRDDFSEGGAKKVSNLASLLVVWVLGIEEYYEVTWELLDLIRTHKQDYNHVAGLVATLTPDEKFESDEEQKLPQSLPSSVLYKMYFSRLEHGQALGLCHVLSDLCKNCIDRLTDLSTLDTLKGALDQAQLHFDEALAQFKKISAPLTNEASKRDIQEVQRLTLQAVREDRDGSGFVTPPAMKKAKAVWSKWEECISMWNEKGIHADEQWIAENLADRGRGISKISHIHFQSSQSDLMNAAARGEVMIKMPDSSDIKSIDLAIEERSKLVEEQTRNASSDRERAICIERSKEVSNMKAEYACELDLLACIRSILEAEKDFTDIKPIDSLQVLDDEKEQSLPDMGQLVEVEAILPPALDDKRIVLVCIDPYIGYDYLSLSEMQKYLKSAKAIIPLIMPSYKLKDYSHWWPDSMPELEHHALFVDCRNKEAVQMKVANELLPQIGKFLEEWRGEAPDASEFSNTEQEEVQCIACLDAGIDPPAIFSRKECADMQGQWRTDEIARRSVSTMAGDPIPQPTIECSHGHMSRASDILSRSVVFDCVECPMCKTAKDFPPYAFNRTECLLYFGDKDESRVGAVDCKKCQKAGRDPSIRILDLIMPEVFVSYNWGGMLKDESGIKGFSTQILAKKMARSLEDKLDLVCWLDVVGGMGAGQDHRKEMQEGISKCTVVVMLLSDSYVESPNCLRELYHAITLCKYIVPVLVPDGNEFQPGLNLDEKGMDRQPSFGWTGDAGKDYWKHCEEVIRRHFKRTGEMLQHFPDTTERIDWSILAHFTPIDYRKPEARNSADVSIVEQVMSRFHRGDFISHKTSKAYESWMNAKESIARELGMDYHRSPEVFKERVRALFEKLDRDSSGYVDKGELKDALSNILRVDCSEAMLSTMMEHADVNRDGVMEYEEFHALATKLLKVQF